MKKGKAITGILISVLALAGVISLMLFIIPAINSERDEAEKTLNQTDTHSAEPTGNVVIDALYSDYYSSLEDAKDHSALIVLGKVIKQKQFSGVSVENTFSVQETLKGNEFKEINVFQMDISSELLALGEEYVLMLNPQTDPNGRSNSFHIIGGIQGMFLIYDNKDVTNSDKDMRNSLDMLRSMGYKGENELDLLCGYLKQSD